MVTRPTKPAIDELMLEHLRAIREELADIRSRLDIVGKLEVGLAHHTESLARAFSRIDMLDSRVQVLEQMKPLTKVIERWVLGAVALLFTSVLSAFVTLIFKWPQIMAMLK